MSSKLRDADLSRERLAELYDRTAAFYDSIAAERQAQGKMLALAKLNLQPGEKLLEVAVGTGWALRHLLRSNRDARVVATDLSRGMLEVANQRFSAMELPVPLLQSDMLALPFADATFDCLLNTHTLEVLSESSTGLALREFVRVLKPGGRLAVANLTEGECLVDRGISQAWQRRYERDAESVSGARPIMVGPLLESAGLEAIERFYCGYGLGWPTEVLLAKRA